MIQSISTWLWWILIPVYVIACAVLIIVVLLQKGKGTGFAGAFGIGPGSEAVFGPRASKSFPVRMTYIMAGVFLALAFILSLIGGHMGKGIAPEKEVVSEAAEVPSTLGDLGLGSSTESEKGSADIFVDEKATEPAAAEGAAQPSDAAQPAETPQPAEDASKSEQQPAPSAGN